MAIKFVKETQQFIIHTANTTYAFDVFKGKYLRHLYYGKKKETIVPEPLVGYSFAPYLIENGYMCSPDTVPCEISFFGSGDFRATSLRINSDGTGVTDFYYSSYRIYSGRASLDGLSEAKADENTDTLEIKMKDDVSGCELTLFYTVYSDNDIIGRYMKVENKGKAVVKIENCFSLELPISRCDFDMISFYGRYGLEVNFQRVPLHHGSQSVFSRRGATSHQYNPFFALCTHSATEESGEVYGFNFIYSGSFVDNVEVDQTNSTKVLVGLGSENFGYTLDVGEQFVSPEAIVTYSARGIGRMSRNFHNFIRYNIMPKTALNPHPVVLNTWEACYFDIDEAKLIKFAEEAAKMGFDMLVMDDGWFGARLNDKVGLGDWFENKDKFPNGLASFVEKIKNIGLKFGIWIEPEMVNPDSDLFRAHPDWAIQVRGREPLQSRQQLVLDMANENVVEYLIHIFEKTFDGVSIDYFKWDMNRHLSNVGSLAFSAEEQNEVSFRYMKGVYRLIRDLQKYLEEVINHLNAVDGCEVNITLEVNASAKDGFSSGTVRTVSENCRTLKVDEFEFNG